LRQDIAILKARDMAHEDEINHHTETIDQQGATIQQRDAVILQQQERLDHLEGTTRRLQQDMETRDDIIWRLEQRVRAFGDLLSRALGTNLEAECTVNPSDLQRYNETLDES
jgi:uncharacterized protein (DUF3084 family)